MKVFAPGAVLDVLLTEEGEQTWQDAERHVPPNKVACKAQLRARLARLADHGRLRNPDLMNSEGEGIHAVKTTCGLRAYGWFTSGMHGQKVFCIGHVVMKKKQRANPEDLNRVKRVRAMYGG